MSRELIHRTALWACVLLVLAAIWTPWHLQCALTAVVALLIAAGHWETPKAAEPARGAYRPSQGRNRLADCQACGRNHAAGDAPQDR